VSYIPSGTQSTTMARKKKGHAPGKVPSGNRTPFGPGADDGRPAGDEKAPDQAGAPFEEQDPKRRLGGFETAGEHAFVQPGGKNDAQRNKKRR
jgi:hypothetical protein